MRAEGIRAEGAHQLAAPKGGIGNPASLRRAWRTYAVAGACLLGLGGLVSLKLWILLRLLLAHFS